MKFKVSTAKKATIQVGDACTSVNTPGRVFIGVPSVAGARALGFERSNDTHVYLCDLETGEFSYSSAPENLIRMKLNDRAEFVPA